MKILSITLALFITGSVLFSQTPKTFNYQSVLRDSIGSILANQEVEVTFDILKDSISGSVAFTESHQCSANNLGLITVNIGAENPTGFAAIDWSTGMYFLKTTINGDVMGISQLLSVPYALHANTADSILNSKSPFSNGDSIVLKDASGATRFIINPNTGSFKMMDNDTIWYNLAVNSPPKVKIVNGDGSYYIGDASAENIDFYRSDGTLYSTIRTVTGGLDDIQTHTFYDANGIKEIEDVTKNEYDADVASETRTSTTFRADGSISTKTTSIESRERWAGKPKITLMKYITTHDNNGNELTERKQEWENGILILDETKENGVLVKKSTRSEITLPPGMGAQRIITKEKSVYSLEGVLIEKINSTKGYNVDGSDPNGSYDIDSRTIKIGTETYVVGESKVNGKTVSSYQTKNGVLTEKKNISYDDRKTEEKNEYFDNGTLDFTTTLTTDGWDQIMQWKAENSSGNSSLLRIEPNVVTTDGDQEITGNSTIDGNQTISGNLNVTGTKNFRINHPLDPDNKYLVHAAIESNEVLNKYSGNVVTNKKGVARINLPDYFDEINTDFRYQLTVIGDFAQAIIFKEIKDNSFEIKTNKPNIKVSWEVTARRNDQHTKDHPFLEEVSK